jgi:hypothetical protein
MALGKTAPRQLSHQAAAQAEREAVTSIGVATGFTAHRGLACGYERDPAVSEAMIRWARDQHHHPTQSPAAAPKPGNKRCTFPRIS